MVKDVVCGMSVDPASAAGAYNYAGQEYFFCSGQCLERFRARPEAYLNKAQAQVSVSADTAKSIGPEGDFTCPMHPEVVQRKPGACPICGMALEPRVVGREEEVDVELLDMSRRFRIGLILTLPLLVLSMSEMALGRSVFPRFREGS